MKIKAAILSEINKPLIIDEIILSKSLQVGQVLVRISVSGICGSQLGEIAGIKGHDKYLPHLLGHEASGTVIDIGPGVKFAKPNDFVVLHWRRGQGIESEPPAYSWRGKLLNAGLVTTFSDMAVISENRLTVIPSETDSELAALFGCAITTGFGVIENNARLKIGESLVVYGAGGVGLNIIQAAALISAYPIIAVDIYPERLALAKEMGATHLLNAIEHNPEKKLLELLDGVQLDCFIDNTGVPHVIELGYKITKSEGRVILVGVPKTGLDTSIFTLPLHFGKKLIGSHGGESVPQKDIHRYRQLFANKRIDVNKIITERYALDEINTAIERMRSGKASGRCMIHM